MYPLRLNTVRLGICMRSFLLDTDNQEGKPEFRVCNWLVLAGSRQARQWLVRGNLCQNGQQAISLFGLIPASLLDNLLFVKMVYCPE